MKEITIIDPVSPEFNRGSFCYSPYILYSYFKTQQRSVALYENFSAADIDTLPKSQIYYLGLWSYPQVEHVKVLLRFLPKTSKVEVFGYSPLIRELNMPLFEMSPTQIEIGIANYVKYYDEFKYILLSDCDMHLSKYSGQVYPLFTSYGCPNSCEFCPATVQQSQRLTLTTNEVKNSLQLMSVSALHKNIHFTDEDFFFNVERAFNICEYMAHEGCFQAIALASRKSLKKFIEKYGTDILHKAGFKLFEVGLESADPDMSSSMKKGNVMDCVWLSQTCDIPILWLTITFFPGETIKTLNATGNFLSQYGFKYEELNGRVRTNGTQGGLGQFFQPYHGTRNYNKLAKQGIILTSRPLRLLPSYIPYSFLNSKVETYSPEKIDEKWFDLYGVDTLEDYIEEGKTVEEIASTCEMYGGNKIDVYVSLAISARLGVLT